MGVLEDLSSDGCWMESGGNLCPKSESPFLCLRGEDFNGSPVDTSLRSGPFLLHVSGKKRVRREVFYTAIHPFTCPSPRHRP